MDFCNRFVYGVSREEVERFVANNEGVADYLGKFDKTRGTWFEYARFLTMFFKWLRVRKQLRVSPKELVEMHIDNWASWDLTDRR